MHGVKRNIDPLDNKYDENPLKRQYSKRQLPSDRDEITNSECDNIRRVISRSLMFDLNLTDHHTNPYNECIESWIKSIILDYGNISTVINEILYKTTISNYRFVRGSMLPSDTHAFNTSYHGNIFVDIQLTILSTSEHDSSNNTRSGNEKFPYIIKNEFHESVLICVFPIMLYSKVCYFSDGYDLSKQTEPEYAGGFIVNGKRRFIPLLKSLINNFPFRFQNKNIYTIQVRSEHLDRRHRSTSTLELVLDTSKTTRSVMFHNMFIKIPFLNSTVPLTVLITALGMSLSGFEEYVVASAGVNWDKELFEKYLIMLRHDHCGCTTKEQALCYIGRLYGRNSDAATVAGNVIQNEVLPHLNQHHEQSKGFYIAYMYSTMVLFGEGKIPATDRDSRVYSCLIDSGTSLAFLFRVIFLGFIRQGIKIARRAVNRGKEFSVCKIYNHRRLTLKLMSAIATGTWSKKRKGMSHPMNTTNAQAIIAQLRRISSSYLNNDGKHLAPRMLHPTAFGYECAAETPEGTIYNSL